MNAAPYWIQLSDMSTEDFPAAETDDIKRALMTVDWAKQENRQIDLKNKGADYCDAGLGVMAEDGRRLVIRPNGDRRCAVEYSFYEKEKFFGFLPRRRYFAGDLENVPLVVASSLVEPFLSNNYASAKTTVESLK